MFWVVSACCGVSINSRVGANITQMSSGRMFWCGIMGSGVVPKVAVATVGWLYDRAARGEPWWFVWALYKSCCRSTDGMLL